MDEENLHIFQAIRGNSTRFSVTMYLIIMFKVTKTPGLYPLSRIYSLGKFTWGVNLTLFPAFLGLRNNTYFYCAMTFLKSPNKHFIRYLTIKFSL